MDQLFNEKENLFFNFTVGVLLSIFLLRIVKIENSGKKAALICFVLHFGSILAPLACLLDGCDNVNLAGHNVPYGVR